MDIRKIWVLLVHHDFQVIGSRFLVRFDTSWVIDEFRNKLKEERPTLSRTDIDPGDLTVWKMKGEVVIYNSTSKKRLVEILNSIDVNDVDAVEEIGEAEVLANVGLPDGQVLLVRLPGSSRISTAVGCVLI
jgi:hypothetical protein